MVADDVVPWIRDMRSQGRQPVEDGEHLEIALEHGAHLSAVDHAPALRVIPHFLLGERRAKGVLRHCASPCGILAVDSNSITHAEARVPPAEQFPDQRLVNPSFSLKHLQDAMAKELLQMSHVQPGQCVELTGSANHPVRHQGMEMRVEFHQIPERLDGDDHPRDGLGVHPCGLKEGLQRIIGALPEFAQ